MNEVSRPNRCGSWGPAISLAAICLAITGCHPKVLPIGKAGVFLPGATVADLERLAATDQVALFDKCLKNFQGKHRDYTCTLVKQERINGNLIDEQTIEVKFLAKPFSVAMKWVKNPPLADRVVYVEGKYGDKMLSRPANGLLRLAHPVDVRKPDDPQAMQNTLRPVNQFGFERSLQSLLDVCRLAARNGDLKQEFTGYADVDGRKTLVLTRYLPEGKGYPEYKTVVYVDLERLIPVGVEGYDKKGDMDCLYIFKDVKFDVGLKEDDFLPERNDIQRP